MATSTADDIPDAIVLSSGTTLPAEVELMATLAVPALFVRAKSLDDPETLAQVPLVFWLVDLLRPRRVVDLGMTTGSVHFAACQAVERSGVEAICRGYGDWTGQPPEALARYNESQYQDFSVLRAVGAGDAPAALAARAGDHPEGSVDLLIAEGPAADPAVLEAWADRLSPRGVVLVLGRSDREPPDREALLRALGTEAAFDFEHGSGAMLLAPGDAAPARIRKLVTTPAPEDGRADLIRRVFRRLGAGQAAEGRLAIGRAEGTPDGTVDGTGDGGMGRGRCAAISRSRACSTGSRSWSRPRGCSATRAPAGRPTSRR